MKKAEIIERLEELQNILNMTAREYADQVNAEDPSIVLKDEDAYVYRTGVVKAKIDYILNKSKQK